MLALSTGDVSMEKITRTLVDDLDGETEATGTVLFGYAGKWYSVDLNDDHIQEFVTTLARHIDAGRLANPTNRPGRVGHRSRVEAVKREDNDLVRAWGREHGFKVPDRGRIPAALLEAYDKRDEKPQPATYGHHRDECEDLEGCEVHGGNTGGNKRTLTSVPRVDKGIMPPPKVVLEWARSNGFTIHHSRRKPTEDMIKAYEQAQAS
jgi:hypothetical protein